MDLDSSPILNLPTELLLLVLYLLDVPDILNIRQTCRILFKTTHERSVWMKLLEEQELYLPLPPEILHTYRHEDRHLLAYSDIAIESIVTNATYLSSMWHRPRSAPFKLDRREIGTTLMGMKLFLDRWLVVVYYEGAAYLYDTQPNQKSAINELPFVSEGKANVNCTPVLRAQLFLESGLWITHVAAVDSESQTIFLALSRSVPPHMVQIYEVDLTILASNSLFAPNGFHLAKSISLPLYKVIRAIEPAQHMIALSTSGTIELVKWDEWIPNAEENVIRKIIRINPGEMDEHLWNGIIAVHFMGPYILIFRTRSIEIHEPPSFFHSSAFSGSDPVLKHDFSLTYREVSFSQTIISQDPLSEVVTYEATLFAYDVLHGLFHYIVRIQVSPTNELPPSLEVVLAGTYPLAFDVHGPSIYVPLTSVDAPIDPPLSPKEPLTYLANFTPSPSPTPTFNHVHAHVPGSSSTAHSTQGGQLEDGSRGFLSTHAIGSQGKRGIWVERKRSSTLREIQVWSHNSPLFSLSYKKQLSARGITAIEIPRRVVYSLYSYDLRDDITCCTLGELTGIIILGHRSGDVSLLQLEA
ncbi:hypothetical protein BDN70DRAFT_874871 [Pholiota conissans]|uniref:F-box domain-containing protein n=1 Tax=Pholiota conissans TaxID=109636 RepID=A0A9P6D4D3_9AGAR|nr:hypothetical protein BDN70DRAFT_874871 [Pholiota conissans]